MASRGRVRLAAVAALAIVPFIRGASAQGERAGTVAVMPGDVAWKPDPRAAGMYTAVVAGDPKQPGLYVLRVKMEAGARLPPHRHPDVRHVTVLTGVFLLGVGEVFDESRMTAYPAGSFIVIPANIPHYGWVKSGESITQDQGWGPTGSTPVATGK